MSNDVNPNTPVVPGYPSPAETAAAWDGYRAPWADQAPSMEQVWNGPGHRRPRNWTTLLILGALIVAFLVAAGTIVRHQNVLPASVPVIGMDSGVAACKAISEGAQPTGANTGAQVSEDQYRKLRAIFADSRYPDIRDNGVELIDVAWQIQSIPQGEEMSALIYIGTFTSSYAGLSGGCAARGYTIPALSAS